MEDATTWLYEFQRATHHRGSPCLSNPKQCPWWVKPEDGKLKLNVDAACFLDGRGTGFVGVVRNEHGKVQGAFNSLARFKELFSNFASACYDLFVAEFSQSGKASGSRKRLSLMFIRLKVIVPSLSQPSIKTRPR